MPIPTPFHARTHRLCTSYRWKEWAGYHAVCTYDTCHEPEYFAFRHAAGMLDVTPLHKYRVTGRDAAAFLAFVMTRDIRKLKPGRVTYCCFCDEDGKVIDDGTIARLDDDVYRATTASPSLHWLLDHARGFEVEVTDVSEEVAALAIQGPTSRGVLAACCDGGVEDLRFFRIADTSLGGARVQVSRTGYTGDLGYEVWVGRDDAVSVWDAIVAAGADYGLLPCGLDALDMTRVEAGFILQDVDYYSALRTVVAHRKSSPFEVGLGWTVALDREPFIGQAALRAERAGRARWRLVGLEVDWEETEALWDAVEMPPHIPAAAWRTPVPVYRGARQVGQATSGTWSPLLKRNLALATVEADCADKGTRLRIEQTVEFHRHKVTARVVDRPFFDPERKRA